jgi:hypothetical protein
LNARNFHHLGAFKISCTQQMQQSGGVGARRDAGCIFSPFHPPLDILPVPCDLAAYPSEHVCRRLSCLPHNLSGKNLLSAAQVSPKENIIPLKKSVWSGRLSSRIQPAARHTLSSLNLSQSAAREKLFPPAKLIIKSQCWLLCCARFFLCVMLSVSLRHRFPAQRRQFYFCFLYHWRESSKHTDGNADGINFSGK